jgi:hypothetical protein
MSLKINRDKIQFRSFSITNSVDGIYIDGTFTANGHFVDSTFGGTVDGYNAGGETHNPPSGQQESNVVDKFPFASEGTATDVGDLSESVRNSTSAHSSDTHGFKSGGERGNASLPPVSTIDKFSFTSFTTATDIGDLTAARHSMMGHSSRVSGYVAGGAPGNSNVIEKFPFSLDSGVTATDVGDITVARSFGSAQNSGTHGYSTGGGVSPPPITAQNVIDKFPFASDNNAGDVGDLTIATRNVTSGQSSSENGYASGGTTAPTPRVSTIQRFPFAVDTDASSVGNLATVTNVNAGVSSTVKGYSCGGTVPSSPDPDNFNFDIEAFPFASDSAATDVGDLTQARSYLGGCQD